MPPSNQPRQAHGKDGFSASDLPRAQPVRKTCFSGGRDGLGRDDEENDQDGQWQVRGCGRRGKGAWTRPSLVGVSASAFRLELAVSAGEWRGFAIALAALASQRRGDRRKPIKVDVVNADGLGWEDGPDGKALYFRNAHGAAQRAALRCEMPEELDLSTGFTVAVLLKTPPELHRSRQYELFFFADAHTQGPGLRVYLSWRMLWLHLHDGAGSHTARTRSARLGINPDTWYHVTVTFDGDRGRIYLNGEMQVEQSGMRMALPAKRRRYAHIGASTTAGSGYGFEGVMSHFMLFPQSLSPEQVVSLYLRH